MKRILTIQDISCLGKCSITVALPIISAMGVEAAILPTAVLSTHTMIPGFVVHDMTKNLLPITKHWKDQNIKFDALYTGYLGSNEEIDIALEIFDDFGSDAMIFVDPVMGDNGKLYPAFDAEYVERNKQLCARADVIVPNITEASLLTGMPYKETYDEAYIRELLWGLSGLGAEKILMTGVSLEKGKTGVMGLDSATGQYIRYQNDRIEGAYHGTGDIFSSVLLGGLMRGLETYDAIRLAADYTAETIAVTLGDDKRLWYGVNFEETISKLVSRLGDMADSRQKNR